MQARVIHDKISTINPATGQIIHSYETTDIEKISRTVDNARTAFSKWKKKDVVERCDYIRSLARVLNRKRPVFQDYYTRNGKAHSSVICRNRKVHMVM